MSINESFEQSRARKAALWKQLSTLPLTIEHLREIKRQALSDEVENEVNMAIINHPDVTPSDLMWPIRSANEAVSQTALAKYMAIADIRKEAAMILREHKMPADYKERAVDAIMVDPQAYDYSLRMVVACSVRRRVEAWNRLKVLKRDPFGLMIEIIRQDGNSSLEKDLAMAELETMRSTLTIDQLRLVVSHSYDIKWQIALLDHPRVQFDDAVLIARKSFFGMGEYQIMVQKVKDLILANPNISVEHLYLLARYYPDEIIPRILAHPDINPDCVMSIFYNHDKRFWPAAAKVILQSRDLSWPKFQLLLEKLPEMREEIEAHPDFLRVKLMEEIRH